MNNFIKNVTYEFENILFNIKKINNKKKGCQNQKLINLFNTEKQKNFLNEKI